MRDLTETSGLSLQKIIKLQLQKEMMGRRLETRLNIRNTAPQGLYF